MVWLSLGVLLVAALYEGLVAWVDAWRFHPEIAEMGTFAVCLLALGGGAALFYAREQPAHVETGQASDDEDDDGGLRRPTSSPDGRDPGGISPDWDDFDRTRASWERTPAPR